MIRLTNKEVFVVASGEPTHWGVHVFDVKNSRKSSEKLVHQIIDNNNFIIDYNKPYKMRITYEKLLEKIMSVGNQLELEEFQRELKNQITNTIDGDAQK